MQKGSDFIHPRIIASLKVCQNKIISADTDVKNAYVLPCNYDNAGTGLGKKRIRMIG